MQLVTAHVGDPTTDEIIEILDRDAAIVLRGAIDDSTIDAILSELDPYIAGTIPFDDEFVGKRTTRTGALVARSKSVREVVLHPTVIDDQVWIPVPYGEASQWAQNVLAAGGCRLRAHERDYRLAEPALLPATASPTLVRPVAAAIDWLGMRYLRLHVAEDAPAGTAAAEAGPEAAMAEATAIAAA